MHFAHSRTIAVKVSYFRNPRKIKQKRTLAKRGRLALFSSM